MDATALSNSLFAESLTAMPWQNKGLHVGLDKAKAHRPVEQADAPEAEELIGAEQEQAAGGDEVEFKDALDEQTVEQGDSEAASESDKSSDDESADDDLTAPAASALNPNSVGQNVDVSHAGPGQRALAVLTYLSEVKLADNPGKAAEAIGAVVEKMLARQAGGEAETAAMDEGTETADGDGEDVSQSPVDTVGQTQPAVGEIPQTSAGDEILDEDSEESEPTTEETAQPGGQATTATVQVSADKESESTDSELAQAAATASDKAAVTEVKTSSDSNTDSKDSQEQQVPIEQQVGAVKVESKDSADKATSKADSGLNPQQENIEQAVISADKGAGETEKGAEVSNVFEAQRGHSTAQLFDKSAAAAIGEQLQASIASSVRQGESEVTVRLNPPELGKVLIKLQQSDGQITGVLEFSKTETRAEAQHFVPQLVRNLQDAGIAVKRLDVVQTQVDNSGQNQSKEYVGQDGLAYQQQSSHGQPGSVGLGYDWAGAESSYSGGEFLSESYISDGAVNVLV